MRISLNELNDVLKCNLRSVRAYKGPWCTITPQNSTKTQLSGIYLVVPDMKQQCILMSHKQQHGIIN